MEAYETGVKYIKENLDSTVPSLKGLKAERSKLLILKDALYDTHRYFQEYQKELYTVSRNVDAILGKDKIRHRSKSRESEL